MAASVQREPSFFASRVLQRVSMLRRVKKKGTGSSYNTARVSGMYTHLVCVVIKASLS